MRPSPAPSRGGCRGCAGCLATLALLAITLVVLLGVLYRAATTPYINLVAVGTSSAAAESAQQKLTLITTATEQAHNTGKPVPVSLAFTDIEMTSLATNAVSLAEQSGSLPGIDGVVVHGAGAGILQVEARVHLLFATLPLYIALHLTSPDHKSIDVAVTDTRLGTIPVPVGLVGGIVDQVRRQVVDRLSLAQAPTYDHVSIVVGVGAVTFNATFEP
jgi:hypothetical protein